MNWAKTGWDDVDQESGGQDKKEFGPRRFWIPAEVTKRVMFLDDSPFCFFEHSLWALTKKQDREICLKKNGIDDRGCPLCEAEMWPSYTGYFSVIDMGDVKYGSDGDVKLEGWTSDKGVTFQFGRKLFGAKRGGKDKPGALQKLQRLSQRQGGLKNTVWDVYRSGRMVESIGDEFTFVERVKDEEVRDYLLGLGANSEYLETDVIDYAEAFSPPSYDRLKRLVGNASPSGTGARVDEDVPF